MNNWQIWTTIFISTSFLLASENGNAEDPQKSINVFINGGYTPDTNFSAHEQEAASFYYGLFKEKAIILNAGGPGSTMLQAESDGTFKRGEDGWIQTVPSIMDKSPAATLENVTMVYKHIAEQAPSTATVVYGDHGGKRGVALWGDEELSASDISTLNSVIPTKTQVRSLFLQCYGEAAMVDPARKIPTTKEGFPDFLEKYYPKNRCALAATSNDEQAGYRDWEKSWANSAWTALFKKYPHISLSQLKNDLISDSSLFPTPQLTSDSMLTDLAHAVCQQSNGKTASCLTIFRTSFSAIQMQLLKTLCLEVDNPEIKKLKKEYAKYMQMEDELVRIRNRWQRQYLIDNYPEREGRFLNVLQRQNEISRQLIRLSSKSQKAKTLAKEYADLNKNLDMRFWLDMKSLEQSSKFEEYFEELSPDWMSKNRALYPALAESYFFSNNRQYSVIEYEKWVREEKIDRQNQRKTLETKKQEALRNLLAPLLNDPALKIIKDTYESITQCESSALG